MRRRAGLLLVACLCACSKTGSGPLAVLRIENLTGDPKWDWTATAGAHAFARQTGSLEGWTESPRDAQAGLTAAGSATRFVHLTLTARGGMLRLEAVVDGAESTPFVASSKGRAEAGLLALIDAVALQVNPNSTNYGTRDDRALQALFAGSPASALVFDGNFDEAKAAAARIEGEQAYNERQFERAALAWSESVRLRPDAAVLNGLAYARAFKGDMRGAVGAAREYQMLRPDDPNVLDTLGEIYFIGAEYDDAERAFLDAFARDPKFLGGAAMAKAALSRLAAGDRTGANALFAKYPSRTPDASARFAFCSGSRATAIETLRGKADSASHATLIVALLASGQREEARRLVPSQGPPLLAIPAFAAQASATAGEWTARADRAFSGEAMAELHDLALAAALVLDRKLAEAKPVLRRIQARTRPAPSDLASALLDEGRYLDPYTGPNPLGLLPCAVLGDQKR